MGTITLEDKIVAYPYARPTKVALKHRQQSYCNLIRTNKDNNGKKICDLHKRVIWKDICEPNTVKQFSTNGEKKTEWGNG